MLPIILNAFPISGSIFQIRESCFQLMAVNNRSQSSLIFMAVLPNFGTQIHHNLKIYGLNFQFLEGKSMNPKFAGIWITCVTKCKQLQYFEFSISNLLILPAIYMKIFLIECLTQRWTLIYTFSDDFFIDSLTEHNIKTNRDNKTSVALETNFIFIIINLSTHENV